MTRILAILVEESGNFSYETSPNGAIALYGATVDNPFVSLKFWTLCPLCRNSFMKTNGAVCNCIPKEVSVEELKKMTL